MQASTKTSEQSLDPAIDLDRFLPYRLSVLSNTISTAIAGAYASRFGLTIPEWRIIAVLGRFPHISAREVAERTAMDKVAVSRAVNRLRKSGIVNHRLAAKDRRRSMLTLSRKGQALLEDIAPLAMDYEARLLGEFNADEQSTLERLLLRLLRRANTIGVLGGDMGDQASSSVRTE